MAGGPPSHCTLNRGGVGGSQYEVRLSRTPHLETLLRSNRGAQPVTGSTAAATALRHHGLHRYSDRRCRVQIFIDEPAKARNSSDGQMLLLSLSLLLPKEAIGVFDSTDKEITHWIRT